jgi:hypothetical protein
MLQDIQIPDLYCPFQPALSPYVETVQAQINQWMKDHQYLKTERAFKRFNAGKFAWTTGRAHPNASCEDILLVATYMSWLFMLDDLCDEEALGKDPIGLKELHEQLLDRMRNPRPVSPDDSPVMVGLVEVWAEMCAQASPQWVERFIATVEDYATGCIWEAYNRADEIVPSIIEYTEMRRKTSALYIFFDLIELAEHIDLPAEVLEHEHIRNLKLLANDGVAWFNDIVSLEKEIKAGDVHNLVLVMQHEYGVSLQEAVDRASGLFNAMVEAYIELEQDTPSFGAEIDPLVQRYLAGLRYWVRGNIDWSYETGRYGQAQTVAAVGK